MIKFYSLIAFIFFDVWIVIICLPVHDVINLEINLSFHMNPFSYEIADKKNLNILKTKRTFKMKQETFSSI